MNIKDIQQQAREEFRNKFKDRKTFLTEGDYYYNDIFESNILDFIDTLIEKTVQMERDRIIKEIHTKIHPFTLNEEYINLITNKSDINKDKE